jgi:tetratricopeptide (TPR) repeat protein
LKNKSTANKAKAPKRQKPGFIDSLSRHPFLIITILAIAVYVQTISFDFAYCDDSDIIKEGYSRIANISSIGDEFSKGYMETDYYRPLIYTSFIIDAQFSGDKPYFYHFTNLLIHCLFCCMLFKLLTLLNYNRNIALIVSLIFAVHPLFTNAVAWIVGRNDMIYGLFGMLSFIALIKHKDTGKAIFLILHSTAFLLAMFSKETAVLFPFLFAGYLIIIRKENIIKKEKAATLQNLIYPALWAIIIGIWYIMHQSAHLGESVYRSGIDVFIKNLPTIPEFIAKFILPINLSVLPTYNHLNTIIGILLIVLLFIIIAKIREKRLRYILFGAVWFFVLTIPGMFMTLLNSQDWNEYLECRAYFPMIGIMIILIEIIPKRLKDFSNRLPALLAMIIIVLFSVLTFSESKNYRNSLNFYESAVKDDPGKALFHFLLYKAYKEKNNYLQAETEILDAIKANPKRAKFYYNCGVFYHNRKRFRDAIKYLKKALQLNTSDKKAYNSLAASYYYLREFDSAEVIWKKTLRKWQDYPAPALFLVDMYLKLEKIDSANYYAEYLLRKGNKKTELFTLFNNAGIFYIQQNKKEIAVQLWEKAIEISPEISQPYHNLFRYYTIDNPDTAKAISFANEIQRLGGKLNIEEQLILKNSEKTFSPQK